MAAEEEFSELELVEQMLEDFELKPSQKISALIAALEQDQDDDEDEDEDDEDDDDE